MFKRELKRAICSWYFVLATIILYISLFIGVIFDVLYSKGENLLVLIIITLIIGTSIIVIPVVCGIPYGTSFCIDYESGYFEFAITRTSIRNYVLTKIVVGFISGASVVLAAIVLFSLSCILVRPSVLQSVDYVNYSLGEYWVLLLNDKKDIIVFLFRVLMLCVFGGIWPVISLGMSIIIKNKYIIMAVPFLVSEIMSYITQLSGAYSFDLSNIPLQGPVESMSFGGVPFALAYSLLIITIMTCMFWVGVERKLKHG